MELEMTTVSTVSPNNMLSGTVEIHLVSRIIADLVCLMDCIFTSSFSMSSSVLVFTNDFQTRSLGSPLIGSCTDFSMFLGASVLGFQVKFVYGYLNEIFVWWHRLPRRVNFLKNFWSNTTNERNIKNSLFTAEPPQLYAVHYLGWKPWLCYRDYDCNFDVEQHVYASDAAHDRWWKVHDAMDEDLQRFCRLTKKRRTELNWERRRSRRRGSTDFHWRINVTDPRRRRSYLIG
ncbi:hypothetical protein Bca101_007645 [Brassica carinata]